jgi:Biotin-lipoyl like
MIVVLLNTYLVILFILVKLKIVPFNLFWKISPVIVFLLLLVGLFIPMGWGAPQGAAVVGRNSVQIVPSVAGEVIEVPVEPNTPLKAGDVLFRIDPVPYESQVKALEAQLKLQETVTSSSRAALSAIVAAPIRHPLLNWRLRAAHQRSPSAVPAPRQLAAVPRPPTVEPRQARECGLRVAPAIGYPNCARGERAVPSSFRSNEACARALLAGPLCRRWRVQAVV